MPVNIMEDTSYKVTSRPREVKILGGKLEKEDEKKKTGKVKEKSDKQIEDLRKSILTIPGAKRGRNAPMTSFTVAQSREEQRSVLQLLDNQVVVEERAS